MTQISGSCLCGAVTYEADCEIQRIVNCHCLDCQQATGSVHTTLVFVPEDAVKIKGYPSSYTHMADSGSTMVKRFCSSCGTQLFSMNSRRQGAIGIRAGTISQKHIVQPQLNIFCDSAVASTPMDDKLPKFGKMPG
jgi:hypothetical protein